MYKRYVKENKDPKYLAKLNVSKLNWIIESNKQKYYSCLSNKFFDPVASMKSYWWTLKMFLNNKKFPCIPLVSLQNKCVTDFKQKAEIFSSFFPEQCSLINNSSKPPLKFLKRTEKVISSLLFSSNDIAKII